jgi:hypothetical protein
MTMTPSAAAASSPPAGPATHGLTFRAKLVLGVCGLVLLTGTVVLWLADQSAQARENGVSSSERLEPAPFSPGGQSNELG